MTEKITYKGYEIKIEQDEDVPNPYKDYDQLSDVNFWIRNYDLDSTGEGNQEFSNPKEVVNGYELGELVYFAPVYGYIHSGISVSLGRSYPFDCPWDSGLAGMVYVTKDKAKQEFPKLRGRTLWLACEKVVKGEIETLNQYLSGDVWWYQISKKGMEERVDGSCGGFYGYAYCLQEAKESVDAHIKSRKAEIVRVSSQAWI